MYAVLVAPDVLCEAPPMLGQLCFGVGVALGVAATCSAPLSPDRFEGAAKVEADGALAACAIGLAAYWALARRRHLSSRIALGE